MKATENLFRYVIWAVLITGLVGLFPAGARCQNPGISAPNGSARPANGDSPGTSGSDSYVPSSPGYLIGAGDILSINVWREAEISQKLVVRPDGMITLPLIGDVPATGQTPDELAQVISKRLESVLTSPQVSVIVAEVHSKFYVVMGEVTKPGQYPLTRSTTVIEAISDAGGFKDFAKPGKIYILRLENGKRTRIPFHYNQVVKGKNSGKDLELSPGDAIVVP